MPPVARMPLLLYIIICETRRRNTKCMWWTKFPPLRVPARTLSLLYSECLPACLPLLLLSHYYTDLGIFLLFFVLCLNILYFVLYKSVRAVSLADWLLLLLTTLCAARLRLTNCPLACLCSQLRVLLMSSSSSSCGWCCCCRFFLIFRAHNRQQPHIHSFIEKIVSGE